MVHLYLERDTGLSGMTKSWNLQGTRPSPQILISRAELRRLVSHEKPAWGALYSFDVSTPF